MEGGDRFKDIEDASAEVNASPEVLVDEAMPSDYLSFDFVAPSPYARSGSRLRGSDRSGNFEMNREQVLDLLAASRAQDELRFEKMMGELKGIASNVDKQMTGILTAVDAQNAKLAGLEKSLTASQSDNQRTRGTVRTAALSLGIGLASLFVATTALLLNGVFGSFNLGSTVAQTARSQAEQVIAQRPTSAPTPISSPGPAVASPLPNGR